MVAARATVVGAAVTLAVLAATCVVAALAHKYISVREEREARDSFAASFADELVYARQLVSDRKYALHGMAEAYNALGAIPSPDIVARVRACVILVRTLVADWPVWVGPRVCCGPNNHSCVETGCSVVVARSLRGRSRRCSRA
jgi:hypothetical protein